MPIHNFEEWEQSVLDQKLRAEKEKMVSEIAGRKPSRAPRGILVSHLLHGLKVVAFCLLLGGLAIFVIRNFTEWFAPLLDFLSKAIPDIMG